MNLKIFLPKNYLKNKKCANFAHRYNKLCKKKKHGGSSERPCFFLF